MTWTINNTTIHINLLLYFIFYVVLIIHELGHIIAVKLTGEEFISVSFGAGKKWFEFNKLRINKLFFIPVGLVRSRKSNIFSHQAFIMMGGNILVLFFGGLLNLLLLNVFPSLITQFNFAILYLTLFSIIPIRYFNGLNSDGLNLYHLIKNRKNSEA